MFVVQAWWTTCCSQTQTQPTNPTALAIFVKIVVTNALVYFLLYFEDSNLFIWLFTLVRKVRCYCFLVCLALIRRYRYIRLATYNQWWCFERFSNSMTITTNILVGLPFQLEKTSEIHDIYIKESFLKRKVYYFIAC